jgi:hypothetical protein
MKRIDGKIVRLPKSTHFVGMEKVEIVVPSRFALTIIPHLSFLPFATMLSKTKIIWPEKRNKESGHSSSLYSTYLVNDSVDIRCR